MQSENASAADLCPPESCATLFEYQSPPMDVLVVMSSSAKMANLQPVIAQMLGWLPARAQTHYPRWDLRLAVISDDLGSPWCDAGQGGVPRVTSCRDRPGEFGDAFEGACESVCGHTGLQAIPTTTQREDIPRPRPWIEWQSGIGSNIVDAHGSPVPLSEATTCMAPQGTTGCEFGQPLEAMHRFLFDAEHEPDSPSFGFLRRAAPLVVVFFSDHEDCSLQDPSIFSANGDKRFWSDPRATRPTPAVCWNAGTVCENPVDGYWQSCEPANKDSSGSLTDQQGEAVLFPLSRYLDLLQEIADGKTNPDARVLVTLASGAPGGGNPVRYPIGTPEQILERGIGAGCSSEMATASPPVRLRQLAETFGGGSYDNAIADLCESPEEGLNWSAVLLVDHNYPLCLPFCAADIDPGARGVQPDCRMEEVLLDGTRLEILPCEPDEEAPFPAGKDTCFRWLSGNEQDESCWRQGANLQFTVYSRYGFHHLATLLAHCEPSPRPDIDCPNLDAN